MKTKKYNPTPGDHLMAYDTKSIMHYDGTLRGYFSTPIMTDKITGISIGVNREMSPLDINKLNQMYPCKSSVSGCGKFQDGHLSLLATFFSIYKTIIKSVFSFNEMSGR